MPLPADIRSEVARKLEEYEGRLNHLYLDSVGKVTVGVGHLVASRAAIAAVPLYQAVNGVATAQEATLAEKQADYDAVAAQAVGFKASNYRKYTKLVMREPDIDALNLKHIDTFYGELSNAYRKSAGATMDFDAMPRSVQMALFDMAFNLGVPKLVSVFQNFTKQIRAGNWKGAAEQCDRPQIGAARNQYVKGLLLAAAQAAAK
ncbi:Pesticin domain-containing protein [Rubrivivax sp. A210]|uniref:hypothetical protein n=1 Tax=Rubrivivax sp. A210 TaxID=2772301 RepID=UPI001918F848|nr:hypothetical protein [Rubrivivax sp. A210]CAD5366128.1 Pesticin domain-containing protein [Rubrivivax sp. A210]